MIARNTPGGISSAGVGRCPTACSLNDARSEESVGKAPPISRLARLASCHCRATLVGVNEVLAKLISRRVPSGKRRRVLYRPDLPIAQCAHYSTEPIVAEMLEAPLKQLHGQLRTVRNLIREAGNEGPLPQLHSPIVEGLLAKRDGTLGSLTTVVACAGTGESEDRGTPFSRICPKRRLLKA